LRLPPIRTASRPPQLVGQRRPLTPGLEVVPPIPTGLQPLGHERSLEAPGGIVSGIAHAVQAASGHLDAAVRGPDSGPAAHARRRGHGADGTTEPLGGQPEGPSVRQEAGGSLLGAAPAPTGPATSSGGTDVAAASSAPVSAARSVVGLGPAGAGPLTTSSAIGPIAHSSGFVALPGMPGPASMAARTEPAPRPTPGSLPATTHAPETGRASSDLHRAAPIAGRIVTAARAVEAASGSRHNLGQSRRLRFGQALSGPPATGGASPSVRGPSVRAGVATPGPTPAGDPGPAAASSDSAPLSAPSGESTVGPESRSDASGAVTAHEVAPPRPPTAPLVGTLEPMIAAVDTASGADGSGDGTPTPTVVAPRYELAGLTIARTEAGRGPTDDAGWTTGPGTGSGASGPPGGSSGAARSARAAIVARMVDGGRSLAHGIAGTSAIPRRGAPADRSPGAPGRVTAFPANEARPGRADRANVAVERLGTSVTVHAPGGIAARNARDAQSGGGSAGSWHRAEMPGVGVARSAGASVPEVGRATTASGRVAGVVAGAPGMTVRRASVDGRPVAQSEPEAGTSGTTAPGPEPAPPSTAAPTSTAQRAGEAGPAADAGIDATSATSSDPGAAPAGGAGPSERDLDALAGRLFDRIERSLRAELLVDRERAGTLVDIGR
jgi:hypothetical protein